MSLAVQPHTEERLRSDSIVWLNSVRSNGRPHSVPVWFFWDNEAIVIFSRPNNQKIRNLRQNPYVTVTLDNTSGGSDVIIIEGTARVLEPAEKQPSQAYNQKYSEGLRRIGITAEQFAASYSQAIIITPDRLASQ